jgi:hypothetical protein
MRPVGVLAVVIALSVSSAVGASTGASARSRGSRVRTVATVQGDVLGFAQDRYYVGWLLRGPRVGYQLGHVGVAVTDDLRTGARTRLPAVPGATNNVSMDPQGLALAGGRAYWEQTYASLSTTDASLATASIHDRRLRGIAYQEIGNPPGGDSLQPPVSDGASVYFWSGTEPDFTGPIVRFDGLKPRRVTGPLPAPAALVAGGGRFAVASRGYDDAGSPAWSPNGRQIAYVRHGTALWLVNADGSASHEIAPQGRDPDWSPDGAKLAYGGPGDTVVIANSDGSDPQVVTSGSDPAWAPNGKTLAVVDQRGIWSVAPDGHDRTLVIAKGNAPDWSPDGRQLVYGGGDDVWLANADGSNQHMLARGGLWPPTPAWSPDGTMIAWVDDFSPCGGNSDDAPGICTIHPDGSHEQVVLRGEDSQQAFYDPAWGLTSNRFAYVSDDYTADGDPHVMVDLRRVTAAPAAMPIVVRSRSGQSAASFESGGPVLALAVSRRVLAALVQEPDGRSAIEIYQPHRRIVPLAVASNQLSTNGNVLVFQIGRTIDTLDVLRGSPRPVATTDYTAIALSIVGNRIAWADSHGRATQIKTLQIDP